MSALSCNATSLLGAPRLSRSRCGTAKVKSKYVRLLGIRVCLSDRACATILGLHRVMRHTLSDNSVELGLYSTATN